MRKLTLNGISTDDSPCKQCADRYVGCHGNCLKYTDWSQERRVKLDMLQKQRDINSVLFDNQVKRNSQLKQNQRQGGLKHGKHNDSR